MDGGVFQPNMEQFMLSPLVTWVKTFASNDGAGGSHSHLEFLELLDGVFLNEIMTQINPSATLQGVKKVNGDPNQRIQNLSILVRQIKAYYLDHLRQLIMIPLPNVSLLGKTPYCEQSLDELKKLLLLLLGCAVQCEEKELYIERIQTLDYDTKATIATHIQEVSQESVLDLQWLESNELDPDELEAVAKSMALQFRHLLDLRDSQQETIAELMQEKEGVVSLSPASIYGISSPGLPQQQHLAVELADSKAKIRRLRQELEEKSEQVLDGRHEVENLEAELKRIQQENSQLQVEARASRTYRDELDALRERAIRADKLESEVGRYRERLHNMEVYRAKVEELKEDNRVLQETKEVLEDQLEGWRSRSDKLHQLEKTMLMLKARLHDMEQEKEVDRRRVEELQEENLALCLAQRRSMEESQHLGWELEQMSRSTDTTQGQSLSEEVSDRTLSRLLRLEKENQRLLLTIEDLRGAASHHNNSSSGGSPRSPRHNSSHHHHYHEHNPGPHSSSPQHSHHHDPQVACCPRSSTERPPAGAAQTCCSHLEDDGGGTAAGTSPSSAAAAPRRMLNGDANGHHHHGRPPSEDSLSTEGDVVAPPGDEEEEDEEEEDGDPELQDLEKGQREEGSGGEHPKGMLQPASSSSSSDLDGVVHNGVHHHHHHHHDHVAGSCGGRSSSPGGSKSGSPHRRHHHRRCDGGGGGGGPPGRSSCYPGKHAERLEAKCRTLDTENQRLQASLDNTGRKLQRLESEVQDLESENQGLQAALEELRISSRRLEQLEGEKQSLEQESLGLERDKRRLEKENRRLRQQAEIQEATLDGSNVRVGALERELRALGKEAEGLRETAERVKGLERDNRERAKQAAIDHGTLATLREELVNEKLKSQQRDNELERLAHELEMKDIDQENQPLADQESPDNSRFKMLESELEACLKRSLQIKQDKMAALEARLQEMTGLNQQLRQELKTVKLSYEALQQRQEEEQRASSVSTPPGETGGGGASQWEATGGTVSQWQRESQEATRELLRVKDRLIEVERNNATLEAERQAVQGQLRQQGGQHDTQQAQIVALQRQTASLQENNTALQTHNANLQVEKSTLSAQCASLLAQNAQLERQQSGVEGEREGAVREREELRGVYEQLLRDHERLAAVHERQANEYEALMGKHGCLKNAHRTLELEHRTLQDRYNSLLQQRTKLEDLQKALKEEQEKMSLEKEQHRMSAAECRRLRDEKDWLNQTYRQLLKDNEELSADHKQLKSQLNVVKLEHTHLGADFSKLREQCQQLDITSTKLTNQCELLGQLKGNLEEENRHLLSQIQSLMLQNQTLLEQTMESKDLFHVEQRQYIDKLNELRRQKEKLEEKIMDQYKFYEPSPPRRRVNWIALKMKKLIKSRSRERVTTERGSGLRSLAPGGCSGSCEGLGAGGGPGGPGGPHQHHHHHASQDNGSDSGGSGGSAGGGDALSPRRSATALKIFPRMRNRLKDRDKVKSLFRRSMSLSDLLGYAPPPPEEDQWADSSEQLDGSETDPEEEGGGGKEDGALSSPLLTDTDSILSVLHPHHHRHHRHHTTPPLYRHLHMSTKAVPRVNEPWLMTGKDPGSSTVPSSCEDNEEPAHHQGWNGVVQSRRAQSESSGEFNLSLDNEPWSNGSSPVQQPPSRRPSASGQPPPSDASTPRHAPEPPSSSTTPTHVDKSPAKGGGIAAANSLQLPSSTTTTHHNKHPDPSTNKTNHHQPHWLTRGTKSIRIKGGSKGAARRSSSDTDGAVHPPTQGHVGGGGGGVHSTRNASASEVTRASACSPVTVLYVQGKASSVSGCLNCFSTPLGNKEGSGGGGGGGGGGRLKGSWSPKTLPRASSVISTAEGSSRRASVNSDCRGGGANKVDAALAAPPSRPPPPVPPLPPPPPVSEETGDQQRQEAQQEETDGQKNRRQRADAADDTPPAKPPRDIVIAATTTDRPPKSPPAPPVQETQMFGSPFNYNSVFSNTIFSDSAVGGGDGTATSETEKDRRHHRAFLCASPSRGGQNAEQEGSLPGAEEGEGELGHCCEGERDEATATTAVLGTEDTHFIIA